ncbi:unnamed protein product [Protopolystoma xenopodis]|uniref:guanylate cyclase n=1 Tax=Protopolystoma xenopodis TaxID=117903 RepID=A0A3S5B464_9PLAT|nr:unnamed protein product [Protopolystoma xenopodis]
MLAASSPLLGCDWFRLDWGGPITEAGPRLACWEGLMPPWASGLRSEPARGDSMYGLIIEGVKHFVDTVYGEDVWPILLELANVRNREFQTRSVYQETIIERLMVALAKMIDSTPADLLYQNGKHFVTFMCEAGYQKLLRVLGRDFVNFMHNLDNLHEYLRFSYPKIRPPSFVVISETPKQIELQYCTKRNGYAPYVSGQLQAIAEKFYNIGLTVEIVSTNREGILYTTIFRLFNNTGEWPIEVVDSSVCIVTEPSLNLNNSEDYNNSSIVPWESSYINSDEFFDIFPFHLVINENMQLAHVGRGFLYLDKTLQGLSFNDKFIIARPFIEPTMNLIRLYRHNNFELVLLVSEDVKKPSLVRLKEDRSLTHSQESCRSS